MSYLLKSCLLDQTNFKVISYIFRLKMGLTLKMCCNNFLIWLKLTTLFLLINIMLYKGVVDEIPFETFVC